MTGRWLKNRTYKQMLEDGDLPKDPVMRTLSIMAESYMRGLEEATLVIVAIALAGAFGYAIYWLRNLQ